MLRFFQFFVPIFWAICGTESQLGPVGPFAVCKNAPSSKSSVDVIMYFNGATQRDPTIIKLICDARKKMPPTIIDITFNVGANVVQPKQNEDYICKDTDLSILQSCYGVFMYACMSGFLTQSQFYDFLCCTMNQEGGISVCVDQIGYTKPLQDCMAGKVLTLDPKKIAKDHSDEVARKGADRDNDYSPYFLFNGHYDKCTSEQASFYLVETICAILSDEEKQKVPACQKS